MRKGLLSLIAIFTLNFAATAGTAELFSQNEAEVEMSMEKLNQLEAFVNANEGISYDEVAAQNPALIEGISDEPTISGVDAKRNRVAGIPSFLWGCLLGLVGLAIVYFVSEDEEETKKALWGCLTAGGVVLLYYLVVILLIGAGAGFFAF